MKDIEKYFLNFNCNDAIILTRSLFQIFCDDLKFSTASFIKIHFHRQHLI